MYTNLRGLLPIQSEVVSKLISAADHSSTLFSPFSLIFQASAPGGQQTDGCGDGRAVREQPTREDIKKTNRCFPQLHL